MARFEFRSQKDLEYIKKLYKRDKRGKLNRGIRKTIGKEPYILKTQSEWSEYLEGDKQHTTANKFLRKLKEETEVLKPKGTKLTGSKPTPRLYVDHKALIELIHQTPTYEQLSEVIIDVADEKQEL